MFKLAPLIMLALSGCLGPGTAIYPNQTYQQPAVPSYQAPQPAPVDQAYQPPHLAETTYIEPRDEAWCRRPAVAAGIMEHENSGLAESARRAHSMAVSYGIDALGSPVDYDNLIMDITEMTAGPHHCIGKPREACENSGPAHECRGIVQIRGRDPIPTRFEFMGDRIEGVTLARDDGQ